jgi:hypothetical protein
MGISDEKIGDSKKSTKSHGAKKERVSFFTLGVMAIVILAVIGLVFGYTHDKVAKLENSENETRALTEQLEALKAQVQKLTEKNEADGVAAGNKQEVLAFLFDRNHTLPGAVAAESWSVYNNPTALWQIRLPENWVVAKEEATDYIYKADTLKAFYKKNPPEETGVKTVRVVMEPKGDAAFAGAVMIQDYYPEYWWAMDKAQSVILEDLEIIDHLTGSLGEYYYYLSTNDEGQEIPTILIFSPERILRATFNVLNRKDSKYLDYRMDFENMIVTLDKLEPVAPITASEPSPVSE